MQARGSEIKRAKKSTPGGRPELLLRQPFAWTGGVHRFAVRPSLMTGDMNWKYSRRENDWGTHRVARSQGRDHAFDFNPFQLLLLLQCFVGI